MSEVLRLASVSKSYGRGKAKEVRVLDGVDLSVDGGETVGRAMSEGRRRSKITAEIATSAAATAMASDQC